ncbi:MAG: MFS transporter [Burkholderiaceae bacterium]|jgi:MFS family permease|nr:MFS transporter [Burkholderiaceae bacterium]
MTGARENAANMEACASLARHTLRGLAAVFGSTFCLLAGNFMLSPLLLLRLKSAGAPTALAGLFAAMSWIGIFCVTPFASAIVRRLGRRRAFWLSAAVPTLTAIGFALTADLAAWFALALAAGLAAGLRWVLSEAMVAELSLPQWRGRAVALFETMLGATFVIGPALLAAIGPQRPAALGAAIVCIALGALISAGIPPLQTPEHSQPASAQATAETGWRGVWRALAARPAFMAVGFVGGFFESGLSSILPLYGLSAGLSAAAAVMLVSASGLGSAGLVFPLGWLADRMAHAPKQRWGSPARVRRRLMRDCAGLILAAALALPGLMRYPWAAGALAFAWGGLGGCLYTLVMVDIGSRERGIALVNGTAVLVLAYTLGGVLAPALGALALQISPAAAFPALLIAVAGLGWALLGRLK